MENIINNSGLVEQRIESTEQYRFFRKTLYFGYNRRATLPYGFLGKGKKRCGKMGWQQNGNSEKSGLTTIPIVYKY